MISFVGAGPGAPDLITLRGRDRLATAHVVVWASSLVPGSLLDHAPPTAEVHDSAGMTLEDVLGVYATHPDARIVRLHSGDPAVYGAIQEQIDWCVAHERDFEIVPGVSSLSAAAAALGRELTIPTVAQSVVLTRLGGRTASSMPERESVAAFAAHGATMAVFLSAARPVELQRELLAAGSGYSADTPAAVVARASWPDEQVAIHGKPVLVDVGTYTYHESPRLRDYFRSSIAHNTLAVDGHSSSEPGGTFNWKSRAESTVGRPA